MLRWALIFLVVALVAGALGLGAVAGTAATIARVLFFTFLVLFAISLISGLLAGRRASHRIERKTRDRDLLHH